MIDIQHIECENKQKTSSSRRNIVPHKEIGGHLIEFWCQTFHRKLIISRFCARAVKIWLKVVLNAAKSQRFETLNRKSWSPRTTVVTDLPQILMPSLTHGHTLFWGMTQFILIVQPYELLSE